MKNPVDLRTFVAYYVPTTWKERIGLVDYVPYFTDEEIEQISQGTYKNGKWYINEAITAYLKAVAI